MLRTTTEFSVYHFDTFHLIAKFLYGKIFIELQTTDVKICVRIVEYSTFRGWIFATIHRHMCLAFIKIEIKISSLSESKITDHLYESYFFFYKLYF